MHVLYEYSRVMGGGGGGVITKFSIGAGAGTCGFLDIYIQNTCSACSDNRGACRRVYRVQGIYRVYTYEARGVCRGACPPPKGKFEFLV